MKVWWSKVENRLSVLKQIEAPGDAALFLGIFVFAAAVPALMRLKLPRLEILLEPRMPPPVADPLRVARIIKFTDAVLRIGRPLVRSRCLTRGLTLYYFLRRAGLDVSLCFGVEKFGDEFAGHCWLVKDGLPFSEPQDPRLMYTIVHIVSDRVHA